MLAGEEFADETDVDNLQNRQLDPVNYSRLDEPVRRELFEYVARLVKLRTTYEGLLVDDIAFLHWDESWGKRVAVWRRGLENSYEQVVVVANFSDYKSLRTATAPNGEYIVPNWPVTPPGYCWSECSTQKCVDQKKLGKEPLEPWTAKVYVLKVKEAMA